MAVGGWLKGMGKEQVWYSFLCRTPDVEGHLVVGMRVAVMAGSVRSGRGCPGGRLWADWVPRGPRVATGRMGVARSANGEGLDIVWFV